MTTWLPDIERTGAPIYVALADTLARDIEQGTLKPGDKLPPQRNLAFDLKVTIGTIGRAYALARERGLVTGEVGRGTYVRAPDEPMRVLSHSAFLPSTPLPGAGETGRAPVHIRLDLTSAPEIGQSAMILSHMSDIITDYPDKTTDYIRALKPEWQQAGQLWLARSGWRPRANAIVPTLGVHAGLIAVVASMTSPGDRVAFEALTYASLARATSMIGRQPVAIRMTDQGIDADHFEHVCANQHPKILALIPTLHNPSTAIMPLDVREHIAATARRYNTWLLEDNIYGVALGDAHRPIASFAPELTFHAGGLSKTIAAGVRAGWIACPKGFALRLPVAHKKLTGGTPFLLTELAARLVLSADADAIGARVSEEYAARHAIAADVLNGLNYDSHPACPFLWLRLEDPWLTGTYVSAARDLGIIIDGDDEFRFTRADPSPHRVRIAYAMTPDREALREALTRLRRLHDAGPTVRV